MPEIQDAVCKRDMLYFLDTCHAETKLNMFIAIRKCLSNDQHDRAWHYYMNDRDKLSGSKDRVICERIEVFFKDLGYSR